MKCIAIFAALVALVSFSSASYVGLGHAGYGYAGYGGYPLASAAYSVPVAHYGVYGAYPATYGLNYGVKYGYPAAYGYGLYKK